LLVQDESSRDLKEYVSQLLAFPQFELGFILDDIANPFGFDLQIEIQIIEMGNY